MQKLTVWLINRLAAGAYRRRINTEEKTKVDAADWGTEFIQFLAVPAILD